MKTQWNLFPAQKLVILPFLEAFEEARLRWRFRHFVQVRGEPLGFGIDFL